MNDALAIYAPIDTLKHVSDNIRIVDGLVINFGFPWPKLPLPTRPYPQARSSAASRLLNQKERRLRARAMLSSFKFSSRKKLYF
jgi:hypothetical protein